VVFFIFILERGNQMKDKDHKTKKGKTAFDTANREARGILETKRLILRRFTLADLDDLYELVYADPVVKNAWSGAKGTPEEIKRGFAKGTIHPQGEFGFRAMVLKETDAVIGLMGFQRHDPAEEDLSYLASEDEPNRKVGLDPNYIEIELTYAMGRPYWKNGYATEMGKAVIVYGFKELGLGRIIQTVSRQNPNSVNLMRRLGFRLENYIDPESVVGILGDYPLWRQTHIPD